MSLIFKQWTRHQLSRDMTGKNKWSFWSHYSKPGFRVTKFGVTKSQRGSKDRQYCFSERLFRKNGSAKTGKFTIKSLNDLKPWPVRAKRLKSYLKALEGLWKENCEKLMQQLSSALVNNECSNFDQLCSQEFVTASTLYFTHLVLSHATRHNAFKKQRHNLNEHMVKCEVSSSIANFFYSSYSYSFHFANLFEIKLCYSNWSMFNAPEIWKPNNTFLSAHDLCDWHSRCYPKIYFLLFFEVSESEIVSVELPIMNIENHTWGIEDENKCSDSSALYHCAHFNKHFSLVVFH